MSSEKIFNTVGVIVGGKGTGKTSFLIGDKPAGISGISDYYIQKKMKVVVYMDFDHPSYRHITTITSPDDLRRVKSGVVRIVNSDFKAVSAVINDCLWNALLVYEDCYKYIPDRLTHDMRGPLIDAKQRNIDVLFMYHSWGQVCRDLARLADFYVMCQTPDCPSTKFTSRDISCLDQMDKMQATVNKNASRFHKVMFNTGING